MSYLSHPLVRAAALVSLGAFVTMGVFPASAQQVTNVPLRVMAANLTGNSQKYEPPQMRILQGLKPDLVALQEFNYGNNTPAQFRSFVDTAFGTNFFYFRESSATETYSIPNGIISRYPFVSTGTWDDVTIPDRGFAWARVDLPGTNDLYVVSVHFKASSGSESTRATEATNLKTLIQASFPSNAWLIVAGDFNTQVRSTSSEPCLATLYSFLSDHPVPTDAEAGGDPDTNEPRSKPYDFVLPSFSLTNRLTNVVLSLRSFPKGLVFDSRVYTPLADVAPVQLNDATNCQHMAIVKDFLIAYALTNAAIPPGITNQPQDQLVNQAAAAVFSVAATGSGTLTYQWRFNETNLAGATASSYTRTNAQPADIGHYSVVVSNTAGSILSSNATLRLNVPAPTLDPSSPGLLRWQGLSNLTYTIQNRTNLALGDWQTLGDTSSPSGTLVFPLPDTNAPQNFFRVVYP
jgi:endonuclease/exonuclease/phosphatase family metal-dependent hydrolase